MVGRLCFLLLCDRSYGLVYQRTGSGGVNGILYRIITAYRVDKCSEEALNSDDCIFLSCCLLKAKMFLSEVGRRWTCSKSR